MTIFEKIAAGEIPSFKIWEDDLHMAFLDIRPVVPGHTLVIPKKAVDPVFAMSDEAYQKFFMAAKKVEALLRAKVPCSRVCLTVIGFEVPHAHIHLLPVQEAGDFPIPHGSSAKLEDLKLMQSQILGS